MRTRIFFENNAGSMVIVGCFAAGAVSCNKVYEWMRVADTMTIYCIHGAIFAEVPVVGVPGVSGS